MSEHACREQGLLCWCPKPHCCSLKRTDGSTCLYTNPTFLLDGENPTVKGTTQSWVSQNPRTRLAALSDYAWYLIPYKGIKHHAKVHLHILPTANLEEKPEASKKTGEGAKKETQNSWQSLLKALPLKEQIFQTSKNTSWLCWCQEDWNQLRKAEGQADL